jgi:predicted DNA-binding protein YlxM (UPF0122 family)
MINKKRNKNQIGEKSGRSKLKENQVKEIRNLYIPKKYSCSKIAKKFNVSENNIWNIVNNKTWTHI